MAPLIGAPRVASRSAPEERVGGRTRLVTRRVTTISSRRPGTAQPSPTSKPPMSPPKGEGQRTVHPSPRPFGARVPEPQEQACTTQDSISWVKFGSVVSHVSFLKTPPETLANSPKELSSPGSIDWSGQDMDTVRRSVGYSSPRKSTPRTNSPEGPQLSHRLFGPQPQPMEQPINSPDSGRSPTSPGSSSSSPSSSPNWSDAEFSDSTSSSDVLTPAPSMNTPEQVAVGGIGKVVYIPRLELPTKCPVSARSSSREEVQEQLGQDFLSLSHSCSGTTTTPTTSTLDAQGTWDENLLREINTALANNSTATGTLTGTKSLDLWEQTPPSGCPGTPPSGDMNTSANFSLRFELPVFELLPPPSVVTPGRQVRFTSPGRQASPGLNPNPNHPAPSTSEPTAPAPSPLPAARGLPTPSVSVAPTPIEATPAPQERVGWGGPREMVLQTPPKPSPKPVPTPPSTSRDAARPATPFVPKSPYSHLTGREAPQQGQRVNVPLVRQRVVYRNGVAVPQGSAQPIFRFGEGGLGKAKAKSPTSPLLSRPKVDRFPAPAPPPAPMRANPSPQHPKGCGCFSCVQDRYYALVRGIREQNHVTLERITAFANEFNARQAAAACAAMNGVADNRGRWQCTGCMLTVDEGEGEGAGEAQEGDEMMATWALELEWQDRTGTPEEEEEGLEAIGELTPVETEEAHSGDDEDTIECEEQSEAPLAPARRNALGAQSRSRRGS